MRAAIHVTATMPSTSIASEVASSLAGTMLAAHRTGIAIGEVNGMRGIVTAYVDSGLLERAQMTNWKIDTAPTPRILPSINGNGRKDDTSTSTTRVVFSSSTELITFTP